jgi:hypothetical protein
MCKNTDLHLKIRTVTVKKPFRELPQVLLRVQKKRFCEDKIIDFFVRYFWVF